MTKKVYLKLLMVITGVLLSFSVWGQVSKTVHVETAGTLPNLITSAEKYQITDLTLTGNLNGTDMRFIREMVGKDRDNKVTNGKLENLNLSGANIVRGGDVYFSSNSRTSNNIISGFMFYSCNKLKNIILPNSVTSIEESAFGGCTGLTSVTIPNSVTSIGLSAFQGCTKLTSINIPNGVTTIEQDAFSNCTGLTSVTIPNSVTYLGGFRGCTGLTSVTIPNSVTSIGSGAFSYCTGLTSVTIGNSVTSIGNSAFFGCEGLTSVTIPPNVTSIGLSAFQGCTKLTSINIPNGVTTIEQHVFSVCTSLTSINIPNGVTTIYDGAFIGCSNLANVTIGNSVTSIRQAAFASCKGLTEIHSKNPIPPSITVNNIFANVPITTCKLYVPKGSKSAYQVYIWKDFYNIIEEDYTTIATVNKENITVKPTSNGIIIETKEKTPVSVFNLSGQKVYQSVINGSTEIRLDKGVYIVRVNNESKKVIVK